MSTIIAPNIISQMITLLYQKMKSIMREFFPKSLEALKVKWVTQQFNQAIT